MRVRRSRPGGGAGVLHAGIGVAERDRRHGPRPRRRIHRAGTGTAAGKAPRPRAHAVRGRAAPADRLSSPALPTAPDEHLRARHQPSLPTPEPLRRIRPPNRTTVLFSGRTTPSAFPRSTTTGNSPMKRRDILKWSASAGGLSLLAAKPSTASAALPVLKPTLPQKIDPISATLRRLELVGRQATYLWTESHINLAGVPMGAVVPATELPALEHQLKTIAKAVEAVTNFAASFATSALASGSLQSLDNLRTRLAALQASFDQLLA
eukprot:gene55301-75792_t